LDCRLANPISGGLCRAQLEDAAAVVGVRDGDGAAEPAARAER